MNAPQNNAPQAVIKSGRTFSVIWVVPIVALLIGGWLAYKAWSEQGPVITIAFETAEGLEAGKTKIKFKDVEIGTVTDVALNDDLTGVVVTAEMNHSAGKYMREKTQFWVVRARVAAGEVTGLGTLLSGAYIGCNPSLEGKSTSDFVGLEKPPVVTSGIPGRHYVLSSTNLGSLDVGSPVYYRGIKVGQVVEYDFDELADAVNIRIFVDAPYHEKVRKNSRFWNASGVDLTLDTEGVKIDTQSLVSILLGGVAFDLPQFSEPMDPASEDRVFRLYQNQDEIEERIYTDKRYYRMYFDHNVRGLAPGAPVEVHGIPIGEVVDITLEVNMNKASARVAVLAMIEPERIDAFIGGSETPAGGQPPGETKSQDVLQHLVERGMRAQLKAGNLLTGQLYVDLDFHPDAAPAELRIQEGYPVLPTLPAPLEQMAQRVNAILKKIETLPLEQISADLHQAIRRLNEALQTTEEMAGGINREVLPEIKSALGDFRAAMNDVRETLGPDAAINYNVRSLMNEMESTARSLRMLIDYVERNPQSVIFGKEVEK